MITLHCVHSSAPGNDWAITVEFRPLTRGFSVWVLEENLMVERPRWRKAGGSRKALTWQAAGAYLLRDQDIRVYGDLWESVSITGVPTFAETVLACLFIEDEGASCAYASIGELLVGFGDEEACAAMSAIPALPIPKGSEPAPVLLDLERIAQCAIELGRAGSRWHALPDAVGLPTAESIATVARTLEALEEVAQRAKTDQQVDALLREPLTPRWQSDAAPDADATARLGRAAGSSEEAARWRTLSARPTVGDVLRRAALVERWLRLPAKPTGGGPPVGMGYSSSEWPVLHWLLGDADAMRALLTSLLASRPATARQLVDETLKRGKSESRYFEAPDQFHGWAMTVMGRPHKRGNVRLALTLQSLADELGIAFDVQHRIGPLPYLE